MIQLIETILGFCILLAIPTLLYLLLFRDNKTMSILFSIIVGNYILSLYIIALGVAHIFNSMLILILSIITAILICFFKDKLQSIDSVNINRSTIFIVLLFAVFILAIQLIIIYPFTSDTFAKYLPWGRIIANEEVIPAFHLQNNSRYVISLAPLLYTHIALLFSLFGICAENFSVGIPLFFSLATIFLIYAWCREFADENVSLFAMIALLSSILFLMFSPIVMQEAPLLFFATALFYLFFKYIKTRDNLYLVLLSLASSLLILSKESGIVLAILVFLGLLVKSKNKNEIKHISVVFLIFNMISFFWLARNFYYYGNPAFPMLTNIFDGELSQYMEVSKEIVKPFIKRALISPQQFFINIFLYFPAIVFAFIYMYGNRKDFFVQFVFACFIILILVMTLTTPRLLVRYMYPFIGVLAVFAAVEMSKTYDWIFPNILIENKRKIANIMIIILMIAFIMAIKLAPVSFYEYQNGLGEEKNLLNYLQQHEGTKDIRILRGAVAPSSVIWYGNYTIMGPYSLSFIVLNEGKMFYLNETSGYYYTIFNRTGIDYVCYVLDQSVEGHMFTEICNDKEHFELVFNGSEIRLWKVK